MTCMTRVPGMTMVTGMIGIITTNNDNKKYNDLKRTNITTTYLKVYCE